MKHWIACLTLSVVLLVTGCDTVNHSQIHVLPPESQGRTRLALPASDRAAVKEVLTGIARKWRLEDRTELSLIPETICSFSELDVKYPMRFVAWVSQERVCVDLFQKPPEAGETAAYQRLRDEIIAGLEEKLSRQVTIVHKMRQRQSGAASKP